MVTAGYLSSQHKEHCFIQIILLKTTQFCKLSINHLEREMLLTFFFFIQNMTKTVELKILKKVFMSKNLMEASHKSKSYFIV